MLVKNNQSGFSLIEMLIVITLMGIVATLVARNVISKLEEGKQGATKIQIGQVGLALDDFRRVCNFYPSTEAGLDALIAPPVGRECKNFPADGFWKEKKVPKDGWESDFEYTSDGNGYVLKSLGADKAPGGTGINADLSNVDTQ
jgi:general secretion pathway protein G